MRQKGKAEPPKYPNPIEYGARTGESIPKGDGIGIDRDTGLVYRYRDGLVWLGKAGESLDVGQWIGVFHPMGSGPRWLPAVRVDDGAPRSER